MLLNELKVALAVSCQPLCDLRQQEGAEEKLENGSQKGSAAGDGEQSLSSSTAAGHFDGRVKSSVKTIDKEAAPAGGEHKLESAILAVDVPSVFT